MDYIIATGYFAKPPGTAQHWFWPLWLDNTKRYSNPREVVVMANGGCYPVVSDEETPTNWIYTSGNLGHCGQLLNGTKPYAFAGNSIAIMTLALYAYASEADFVYKEQDCLCFGPWVEQLYKEIGGHGCIFGKTRFMPSAEAILMIRHEAIPEVVRLYLATGHEGRPENCIESKFLKLLKEHPKLFCQFSFGYDRDRPFNVNDQVWYAQKLTGDELVGLEGAGHIPHKLMETMPQDVKLFSNGP